MRKLALVGVFFCLALALFAEASPPPVAGHSPPVPLHSLYVEPLSPPHRPPSGPALPPAVPGPSVETQPWPLLYQDDFSNPASGWPVATEDCFTTAYQAGEYAVNILCPQWLVLLYLNLDVTDFEFSLDGRTTVAQADVTYGQIFRAVGMDTPSRAYYLFEVYPPDRLYAVSLFQNNEWTTLIDWTTSSAINSGTAKNVMRVVGVGSNFQLYINDQQVNSFTDSTLPSGSTGFAVFNYRESGGANTAFDNYKLWGVRVGGPTPSPTATQTVGATATATRTLGLFQMFLPIIRKGFPLPTPTATRTSTPEMTSTPTRTPQPGAPLPGHWVGTTSRGHPMSFDVSLDSTQWFSFTLTTDWSAPQYGATGTTSVTINGPGPIVNGHFNYSGTFAFSGDFTSSNSANGTYTFTNFPIVIGLPGPPYVTTYYLNQSGTWTANKP